ncbi:MAG: type II toxin-antitoxin system VapC family toxin [Pirellulales bacterium]
MLDTNIMIALIDREISVRDRVAAADEVLIPSPVFGELYFGAFNSERIQDNLARVDDYVRWYPSIPITAETARIYGAIRKDLQTKGKPIPENDIWIAAAAKQTSTIVATRDDHFDAIDGIAVEKW